MATGFLFGIGFAIAVALVGGVVVFFVLGALRHTLTF
jgi:hypothetical protein